MAVLKFQYARETVIEQVRSAIGGASKRALAVESVPLLESRGRVLGEPISADRDFPPFPRATRDGFAVRAADVARVPAELQVKGEVRAGTVFSGAIHAGECVEIMTGAPVPEGADAVVMVEYTSQPQSEAGAASSIRAGCDPVRIERTVIAGENVVLQGSEARRGDVLVPPGRRIGYGEIAMMAAVGRQTVSVYRQPRVAIIPTGDEVVEIDQTPQVFQIRNSNGYSLCAQVARAHSIPVPLGIGPDRQDRLKEMIAEGLRSDLLLLSGGVSMGKYDLVEKVLAEFQAEFFFDGVAIQPGRPLVFGRAQDTFVFGLPGNPLSTMVTFELFVRPALALLAGEDAAPLIFLRASLARDVRVKPGLTRFLPARLEGGYHHPEVSLVGWQGSGDVAGLNRANCYLVVSEETEAVQAGQWVSVLPR